MCLTLTFANIEANKRFWISIKWVNKKMVIYACTHTYTRVQLVHIAYETVFFLWGKQIN